MYASPHFFESTEAEQRLLKNALLVSMACHIVVLAIIVFMPDWEPSGRRTPSAITVNMVSLGPPTPPGPPPKAEVVEQKTPVAPEPPEPEPVEVEAPPPPEAVPLPPPPQPDSPPKKAVPIKPKEVKPKKSLKKDTYKPEKVVKSAVKKIEKDSRTARPKQITDAIASLKNKGAPSGAETSQPSGAAMAGGGSGPISQKVLEQIDIYKAEVAYRVQKNWAFSEQLARGNLDIETVIVIRILPGGKIKDVWYEKKSGNVYLDESAFKAVKKSDPLPPLPQGYRRPHYSLGLVFTPKGLK